MQSLGGALNYVRPTTTVFELDSEPHPELLYVERRAVPIDADALTDITRLIR